MWLYLMAGLPFATALFFYLSMKKAWFTFGIGGLEQEKDHSEKEWKTERSRVPISTGKAKFEIETDVKWCPETDEIYYRTPENTSFFEKEWKEISEYSDLYERLLENFKRKYQSRKQPVNRTQWTRASKHD